tara:strand:- start:2782 stop:2919 length:138 start_codon:yes stop_codon:yes gene_type:complete
MNGITEEAEYKGRAFENERIGLMAREGLIREIELDLWNELRPDEN